MDKHPFGRGGGARNDIVLVGGLICVLDQEQSIKVLVVCSSIVCAVCSCGIQQGFEIGTKISDGDRLLGTGKYSQAQENFSEALTLIDRELDHKELSGDDAAVLKAHVLTKLGTLYTNEKNYPQAQSKFKEALKLYERIADPSATVLKSMKECLTSYAELARVLNQQDMAKELDDRAGKVKF